jgi:hypothetical protein
MHGYENSVVLDIPAMSVSFFSLDKKRENKSKSK